MWVTHGSATVWRSAHPAKARRPSVVMRGAVTVTVEYRVRNKQEGVTPIDALEDAAMIQIFIRKNAHLLGDSEWDIEAFERDHLKAYLGRNFG